MAETKSKGKIDCFAYSCGACGVLNDLYCAKEGKCNFYKTVEQYEEDQRKAENRLKMVRGEETDV